MSDVIKYKWLAKKLADALMISRVKNEKLKLAREKHPDIIEKLALSPLPKESLSKQELRKLKTLMHPKYGPAVYEYKGKYFLKKEQGLVVKIIYNYTDARCTSLAHAFREECWRRGATVIFVQSSSNDAKKRVMLSPPDALAEVHDISVCHLKHVDVIVYIGGDELPDWKMGLEDKLKAGAYASQIFYKLADRYKTKRCILGFPVKKPRKYYPTGMTQKEYEKIYINSIKQTFSKKVANLCEYYFKALNKKSRVHVTANDGTDLRFSIENRMPALADGRFTEEKIKQGDVILNIPDGEVFIAPVENSAYGKIKFDYISLAGFGVLRDFWLEFKRGRIVNFWGTKKDVLRFEKYLETHTGDKDRIAELGIGTNPAARFVNETIVDEKILGSIHIAIGDNRAFSGGKNTASNHQDMIKMMKGCDGRIYVDNELIMKDGMPAKPL